MSQSLGADLALIGRRRTAWSATAKSTELPFPAFFSHPYAMLYAGFMTIMVAISFDIPAVSTVSYKLRWPVMALFALAGVIRALSVPGFRVAKHYKFLMTFIVLAAASAGGSMFPGYSFLRSVSLGMLFSATGIGLCHYCMNRANLVAFTDAVWCIGAFMVATGFVFRTGDMESQQRFVGLQNSATGAGTYAALFLPIALYQIRYRFRGLMAPIGWLVVALMIVQPVLASARTALVISFFVGSALCFDYYGRKAQIVTMLIACLMPLVLLIDTRTLLRLHDKADRVIRQSSLSTFTGRLDRWRFGVEQWARKPILGHGLGASRYLAGIEAPQRFNLQPGEVFNWHSDQVEILADLGAVGSLTFNLMWLTIGFAGLKVILSTKSAARQLALAYLGSIAYAFVDTFMHGGFVAAGGGTSTYSWSFMAVFSAVFLTSFSGNSMCHRRSKRAMAQTKHNSFRKTESARVGTAVVVQPEDIRSRLPSIRELKRTQSPTATVL